MLTTPYSVAQNIFAKFRKTKALQSPSQFWSATIISKMEVIIVMMTKQLKEENDKV